MACFKNPFLTQDYEDIIFFIIFWKAHYFPFDIWIFSLLGIKYFAWCEVGSSFFFFPYRYLIVPALSPLSKIKCPYIHGYFCRILHPVPLVYLYILEPVKHILITFAFSEYWYMVIIFLFFLSISAIFILLRFQIHFRISSSYVHIHTHTYTHTHTHRVRILNGILPK